MNGVDQKLEGCTMFQRIMYVCVLQNMFLRDTNILLIPLQSTQSYLSAQKYQMQNIMAEIFSNLFWVDEEYEE